jgi:hypothetical protein
MTSFKEALVTTFFISVFKMDILATLNAEEHGMQEKALISAKP